MGTQAITRWDGRDRPAPADLRGAAYDAPAASRPRHTLLVCAAPRSSSKRLARLLLAAGLGVPMEYFNETTIVPLTARWQIARRQYLAHLYARRSANGVFVSNLQHRQIEAWSHPADFDDLLAGACVVHLVRGDKPAQAASLAACWLTGEWGFATPAPIREFSRRELKRAAKAALAVVTTEDGHLQRWFERCRIEPVRVAADEVNRRDLAIVERLAARLDTQIDRAGAERMLHCDGGPYRGCEALKSRLREYLPG